MSIHMSTYTYVGKVGRTAVDHGYTRLHMSIHVSMHMSMHMSTCIHLGEVGRAVVEHV